MEFLARYHYDPDFTGKARSWLDVALALFAAIGREPHVEFIDMPPQLIEKYQYFTEAKMGKLISAGYSNEFTELEPGIGDYARAFLAAIDPYR